MLPSCNSRHIQFIHGVVLLTLPSPNRHLGSRSPVCHRPHSTPLHALCASMQCCSGLGKASIASVSPACSLRATVAACRSRSCVPQRCNALNRIQHQQSEEQQQQSEKQQMLPSWSPFAASFAMYLLTEAPAMAEAGSSPFAGVQSSSLYVTLALFLMSVPGECMPGATAACSGSAGGRDDQQLAGALAGSHVCACLHACAAGPGTECCSLRMGVRTGDPQARGCGQAPNQGSCGHTILST